MEQTNKLGHAQRSTIENPLSSAYTHPTPSPHRSIIVIVDGKRLSKLCHIEIGAHLVSIDAIITAIAIAYRYYRRKEICSHRQKCSRCLIITIIIISISIFQHHTNQIFFYLPILSFLFSSSFVFDIEQQSCDERIMAEKSSNRYNKQTDDACTHKSS